MTVLCSGVLVTVRLVTVLPLGDVTVVDFLETDLPLGVVEVLLLTVLLAVLELLLTCDFLASEERPWLLLETF